MTYWFHIDELRRAAYRAAGGNELDDLLTAVGADRDGERSPLCSIISGHACTPRWSG